MSTMTEADAWEIYDSEAGKQGRPSAKFKEAKLWLIEKELLNKDDAKSTTEKKDKKPPLELKIINNPLEISVDLQKEIYMEAFVYIQDKRNFDFNYYLTGRYGITSAVMKAWEQDPEMRNLRVIAAELMELKMSDALCDKWSGGNPLGLMLRLKSAYGWNDKGEGGSMMPDGNIGIIAEYTEEDMAAMDYGDSNEEYLNEDSE